MIEQFAKCQIPTSEILNDIKDTEKEIAQMEIEVIAYRMLPDRLSQFKADGRISGISERKIFIDKLKNILASREACK